MNLVIPEMHTRMVIPSMLTVEHGKPLSATTIFVFNLFKLFSRLNQLLGAKCVFEHQDLQMKQIQVIFTHSW